MRFVLPFLIFGIVGSTILIADRLREKEIVRSVQYQYYDVDAQNREDILEQFKTRGPRGFGANTLWEVKWNWRCEVTVSSIITLPRHTKLDVLPEPQRKNWNNFLIQLQKHEMLHVEIGEMAAKEIQEAKCFGAENIIRYWALRNQFLDVRTKHGRTDGVVLGW